MVAKKGLTGCQGAYRVSGCQGVRGGSCFYGCLECWQEGWGDRLQVPALTLLPTYFLLLMSNIKPSFKYFLLFVVIDWFSEFKI